MTADITQLPLRHNWVDGSERRIPACESPDGNDRTEKACAYCGIVKVTIHYPNKAECGREWITSSGTNWVGDITPPCIPKDRAEVPA